MKQTRIRLITKRNNVEIHTEHILSYLENRLSAAEKQRFEELLASSPEFRKEVDDIRFIRETTEALKQQSRIDTTRNWNALSQKIRHDKYTHKAWTVIRSAAAILLIPVLIATFSLYNTLKELNNQSIKQIELSSAYGLISKITLPDGSEVWLNSGSHLSYPERFSGSKRTVQLSGEAYFKVTSDQVNRFDVEISNGLVVSAYGTEFNVNAYEDESKIEAILAKGNIEITQTGQPSSRTLNPGQQVVFDKGNNQMHVSDANLSVKTAWKDGKVVFRRANMDEICHRLSRHFNVDIRLEGEELHDYEYSATFTTETLNEILRLLEKTAPIQCRIIEPKQDSDFAYSRRTVIITHR